ncbi:acetylornithine deacetylase [Dysgonomonas sp. PFB1-18]|uniref:M20 family metallo-hydrolase n=1 Tax=unclassified Dysgonomonas TaxID=2630389 RepID=UPI002474373F|nr:MULTISPECIES: M20 family metallo-hydrolase [unclassified Dysgonomonas]MDH6307371.1 acetylornithine deacetylase [Dysgonomonas sp. PF1-14]MDH6337289.1 acetylornithine deacetylase [Dysgonomonas sp. PF1-16]MDH6379213.1 acetylornithine deacetylase [Dysgonomonas sp. PFB1-18]
MITDIDSLYYSAIDLLKEMIATPSLSREEQHVADKIATYMAKMGYEPNRKGNNLWIKSKGFDESKLTILLNSHIDTVKPVAGWQRDPFAPLEEDDKLYGLGSNDAGASLVSLLHVFFILSERKQDYNLIFLASCEEEVSGKGGVELVLPDLPAIEFGIVGEPTGMNPAIAEKGLMVLDCTSHGKSGHAARNEGENAIYKAMKDIEWFRTFRFPKESDLLGAVKMTVTVIEAGTQHNVVPDKCTFAVDVRSNELYSNEELFEIIDKHTLSEVSPRSFRLNSSRIALENPFVQRAIMIGKEPYGSPTLSDQSLMPFPTVKMGPGDSARSHTADEYIRPEEIREAIELYVKLLDGLRI